MNGNRKGWVVVLAGTGINLAFGVLYAWSIFGAALQEAQGWTAKEAALPYTVAILMFAAMMIPAGRLQDRIGPRWVVTIGGVLIGLGCIMASFMTSLWGMIFSFGVLAGSGIGLGYASTTPAAVKWFAPEKKGLITGIVVGGFGLASLYIAPLSKYLLAEYGVFNSFRILGVLFLIVILPLAQLVKNPPVVSPKVTSQKNQPCSNDCCVNEMVHTKQFFQLWFMFFAGATGGLMVIGHLKSIATLQLGRDVGFALVAFAAIANALGRPIAGVVSDKLGRGKTMTILYIFQGLVLLFFGKFTSVTGVFLGAAVIYFAYGSMLSVFPSACCDNYGTKNLGLNYGVMFSAWGLGGVVGPLLGGAIVDATGSYSYAFYAAAAILSLAAYVGFVYRPCHSGDRPSSFMKSREKGVISEDLGDRVVGQKI